MGVILDDHLKKAIQMYKDGMTISDINKQTGVAKNRMTQAIREFNIPKHKNIGSKPRFSYNQEFFSNINTEERAYWLGFLYADGYVSTKHDKFSLSISVKDRLHLEKLRDSLCPDKPIEEQHSQNAVRFTVISKRITGDLIMKGCVPQKSLILQPPPEGSIPDELIRHFIRGYFDGDGCARIQKGKYVSISLVGTKELLQFMVDRFTGIGCKFESEVRSIKRYYTWECSAKDTVKRIYHYFYTDATVFLERKEEKMRSVFSL